MDTHENSIGFSPNARWIWAAAPAEPDAWWMFRRTLTLPADCRDGQLLVTAAFHYLLYVNGALVTRGPARSYDFRKAYDTVDVQPYLRLGHENVLAILAPTDAREDRPGVLAELRWRDAAGERFSLVTDSRWKVQCHEAFKSETAGQSLGVGLLLGREEWFDARRELRGWNAVGFDDSDWESASELGAATMAPWTTLEPSGIGLLSDDSILPSRVTAIELARLRPGYRIRFVSPPKYENAIRAFSTKIECAAPAPVRFVVAADVYLNGRPVASGPDAEEVVVPAGKHFLSIQQAGHGHSELELLLETEEEISFSASEILGGREAPWALCAFPAVSVEYPWHETVAHFQAPPELEPLLAASDADQIPESLRSEFMPIAAESGSVSLDVRTQYVYRARSGHADPAIERGQPRLKAETPAVPPMENAQNLLHSQPDPATLLPTPGYDVHFIVDFDRERIGYVEFTVDAPAGTVIDAQCFELIDEGGVAWMNHNGFRYICRDGVQTFTSHFRRGFRYVSITVRAFERPVRWYALRCRQAAYPVSEVGGFACSDPRLNETYRMSIDTAAVCMLDTYVDCPGHEQTFWVGDARITALISLLAFGAFDFDQHCIRLVGQSLSPEWVQAYWPDDERYTTDRYLPIGAFPNYPEGGLPMWALLWGIQCWDHWQHGGGSDDLKENFGYVAEMLRHCRLLTNERGLLDIPGAWNLIEWGATDVSPYGEVTANNVLLVECLRLAAKMAAALGLSEEVGMHTAEARERQAAVNRFCWDDDRKAYVDTVRDEWAYERYRETCRAKGWSPLTWEKYRACGRISEQTNTLAALCDCVPAERLEAVRRIVRRVEHGRFITSTPAYRTIGPPPEEEAPGGIVAVGSPFFLFFTLGALFRLGEDELALEVMRREWGKMADAGFRTCPETFEDIRSAAHAWSAAPAAYLPSHVLGIRPLEPGYRTFVVDPCPGNLEWARGAVATPYGPIQVRWKRHDEGELEIACTAPAECRRVSR